MPDPDDPSVKPKKHRVIYWNPEDEENAVKAKSSNTKLVIGGLVAVAVIVCSMLAYRLVFAPQEQIVVVAGPDGQALETGNLQTEFVTASKAKLKEEATAKKVKEIEQMQTKHQTLTTMQFDTTKEFLKAKDLMSRSKFTAAIAQFEQVEILIEKFTTQIRAQKAAQEMYSTFLNDVRKLEGNKQLNQAAYDKAFEVASAGNQFLELGSFEAAKNSLQESLNYLKQLSDSIKTYVSTNASKGHRYIGEGKGALAIEAFTNVLKIDPGNEEAVRHLERAKFADQTYALLVDAKTNEDAEKLEDALGFYERAFELDNGSAKAQQGVSRVKRSIENRDFNKHLTAAQEAEARGNYEDAIANYQAAMAVFPTRVDLADSISNARYEKRRTDIVNMITLAYDLEKKFEWQGARNYYEQILKLEPDLQEATDGMLRTGKMLRSLLRYEKLLEVSVQEAQRAEFQLAIRSFDIAMQSKPEYLELSPQAERLRNYLQVQSQPVDVRLISDMDTWVSVQGGPTVIKPAKLKEENIALLPGKYYVTGRKKGYQDIRVPINIRAGINQDPLTVICNVKQ